MFDLRGYVDGLTVRSGTMSRKAGQVYRDYEREIDDLLKIAGITKNVERARSDLVIMLSSAHSANASQQEAQNQPPPDLLEKLEKSITETRRLLARAKTYGYMKVIGNGSLQVHGLETNIVKAASIGILGKHKEFPTIPDDRTHVIIDIENLLHAWHDSVEKIQRRKPGRQKEQDKLAIAVHALEFFKRYSPKKPSTNSNNPVFQFAKKFYRAVTKAKSGGLDRQIRALSHRLHRQARGGAANRGLHRPISQSELAGLSRLDVNRRK